MRTSEHIDKLIAAMVTAQSSITPPAKSKTAKVKTKTGGEYSFDYADLPAVLDAVRKPLADNGLAVIQGIAGENGHTVLHTRLMHQSGQWVESDYPMNFNGDPQGRASELTYARRYSLCAMVGIAAEDDDDGNGASGNHATTTPRQRPAPRQQSAPPQSQADRDAKFIDAIDAAFTARGFAPVAAAYAQRKILADRNINSPLSMDEAKRHSYVKAIRDGQFDDLKAEHPLSEPASELPAPPVPARRSTRRSMTPEAA